jgi:predicted dehydrogenase
MSDVNGHSFVRVALLGAGSRGVDAYGAYVLRRPDLARIVAIAEPREDRLMAAAQAHEVGPVHCYASWEDLLARETELDAVVIATPDNLHLKPSLASIEKGFSILLEKPICPTEEDVIVLRDAARERNADITVAHVLRHTTFFSQIRSLIESGVIGRLQTVQHTEQIGYWHFAHSYVRGNWRRRSDSSPMIVAKACHDFDMLRWLIGARCEKLSSFGHLGHFTLENAPEGSTERCDQGCAVERTCPYSAIRIYLEKFPPQNNWPHNVLSLDTSPAGIARALHEGQYGRCVYRCDNDVNDRNVVSLWFANGVSATLNVSAFTGENTRTVHLMGTHGEILGDFNENELTVTDFRTSEVRHIRFTAPIEGRHGGGDDGVMSEFLARAQLRRRQANVPPPLTSLEESLDSHLMAFAAEKSRRTGEMIELSPLS